MFLRHLIRWPSVDIQVKFYGDRPRGREINTRGVAEYSDFGPRFVSETVSFRLVPNSVTLDDLERRNSLNRRVTEFSSFRGGLCVKVVEDTPIFSTAEM